MAVRRPQVDPAERLFRIADLLADLAEANPSRSFDEQAEQVAKALSPRVPVTRDPTGRPCVSWIDGERWLQAAKRDQLEVERDRQERLAEAERTQAMRLPMGVVAVETPDGTWYAPGHEPNVLPGGKRIEVG